MYSSAVDRSLVHECLEYRWIGPIPPGSGFLGLRMFLDKADIRWMVVMTVRIGTAWVVTASWPQDVLEPAYGRFGNGSLWKLRHLLSSLPAYLEPLQPNLAESFGPDFSSMNTLTWPYSYVPTIEILAVLTDTEHVPIRILWNDKYNHWDYSLPVFGRIERYLTCYAELREGSVEDYGKLCITWS